jgi:hypothetical protein
MSSPNKDQAERGFLLTTFLILVIFVNSISVMFFLFKPEIAYDYLKIEPNPSWENTIRAIAMLGNVFCAVEIWKWKKIGYYGIIAITIFSFFLNMLSGTFFIKSLTGFFLIVVFWLLIRKEWFYYK